ncbi:MAG: SDR family NAD(P)-dependent oxidoreductase, partial [Persicimonas sp.]
MKDFQDRVVAVTGAASGIGRALAVGCAARGAHLAVSDIDEEGLAETVDRVAAHGVPVDSWVVDVADRGAVEDWADDVVERFGRVNVIVNNAGVSVTCSIEELSYEDFEWLMSINFWGVVHGTKAFLPHLRASGEGHVVNISSIFGV